MFHGQSSEKLRMKISVIMPSYLGEYQGAASDREEKLIRAIHSFNEQTYVNRELIIISDGCDKTMEIANRFNLNNDIIAFKLPKQKLFSGRLRHEGVLRASGDYICYLDSDDVIGNEHLNTLNKAFSASPDDWFYYNDYVIMGDGMPRELKVVELEHGSIGTSSIAHKKSIYNSKLDVLGLKRLSWKKCDGYGHDWTFIKKLIDSGLTYSKIVGCDYNICHIPKLIDQ